MEPITKDLRDVLERLRHKSAAADVFELEAATEADQQRQRLERRQARAKGAGVPLDPEAAEAAIASPGRCPRVDGHAGSVEAAKAVEAFVGQPQRSLLLLGPTGRGKSFAATWLLVELGGAWLAAADCRVGAWDDYRAKAVGARLLVVDDLGRESTDWAARELADLLELRHNRGLRTVATSNLPAGKLFERYGERLASRWADRAMTTTVEVLGADLRRRGQR